MRTVFVVLSVICLLLGLSSCASAKTVIHEISAYVWLLMATAFFVGAAVLEKLDMVVDALKRKPAPIPTLEDAAPPRQNARSV